ncbi:hypothetical protein ACH41E_19325 [Streptomyces sp. NPDC020412]|uniref:hypothetical protein n=1 Tax=Streptomyces sp. NPDC020412 TaxID=3365073 RepID=UPI003798BC07
MRISPRTGRRSPRVRAAAALAGLPLGLALFLTGCGGSDGGGKDVASAESGAPRGSKDGGASGGGSGSKPDPKEGALKFAQCMRENGIAMEDPQDGRLTLKGEGVPKEKMDKAQKACAEHLPQGDDRGQIDPKVVENMRKYARCMRENGVEDFPDPAPGGGIKVGPEQAQNPNFKKAEEKCKNAMPKPPEGGKLDG